MSAAEPADSILPAHDRGERAAVIDITKKRARASRRADTGRWTPVSTTQPGTAGGGGTTPQQQFAEHSEIVFNRHGLTLTDEDTATAYRVTLQLVREVLAGAEGQGVVDGGQRLKLDATLQGLVVVPGLVEQSV